MPPGSPAPDPDDVFAEFFGRGGERRADTGERYLVEIESLVVGIFRRCEGLVARRQVIEVHEGGREEAVRRLGPYAEGLFRLVDGEADGPVLYDWAVKGSADHLASSRRSGCVILVDRRGEEIARWKFRLGVVTGWEGPTEPPGTAAPYEVQALEVTHEGLEAVLPER